MIDILEKVKRKKKIIKIGLAFSFKKIKKIPLNKYDMKLDFVITGRKILMRILFLGDVVGNSGCLKLKKIFQNKKNIKLIL